MNDDELLNRLRRIVRGRAQEHEWAAVEYTFQAPRWKPPAPNGARWYDIQDNDAFDENTGIGTKHVGSGQASWDAFLSTANQFAMNKVSAALAELPMRGETSATN